MFQPATKSGAKVRMAMFGPPGSGKSFSSLGIATGLGGSIFAIDTERGRLREYADRFPFQVCELKQRRIEDYVAAMKAAASAGAGVLVVDSLSHAWEELVDEMGKLAQSKFSGNTLRAWGIGTPKQREFIDTMFSFPGHLICTMRAEIEYAIETDDRNKVKVRKLGLKPKQGKDIEYEFSLLGEVSREHSLTISKDSIVGTFQDRTIDKPGKAFGEELVAAIKAGAAPEPKDERPARKQLDALIEKHNITDQTIMGWYQHFGVRHLHELNDEQLNKLIAKIAEKYPAAA